MPLGVSNPIGLQLIGNGSLFDPFIGPGSLLAGAADCRGANSAPLVEHDPGQHAD